MSEHETFGDSGSTGWLTPTAAGIGGLTIAAATLLSNGAWLLVVQGWLNRNGSSSFSDGITLSGIAQAAVAVAALVLARRAHGSRVPLARDLGGAAAVVAGLGLLLAVLTILVGLAGM